MLIALLGMALAGPTCPGDSQPLVVRGTSMTGLVEPGATVHTMAEPCRPLEREDLVTVRISSSDAPILKQIRALPGDTLSLQPSEAGTHIVVNGSVLTTAAGPPFALSASRARMLELYATEEGLTDGTYLVLGTDPGGTRDSSRFGLVHIDDITGLVVKIEPPNPPSTQE